MNNINCPPSPIPSGTRGDGKLMCDLEWPHSLVEAFAAKIYLRAYTHSRLYLTHH